MCKPHDTHTYTLTNGLSTPTPPPPPPTTIQNKQARGLLLKTLVLSLVVTAGIWAFPYEAIGWEPTNEHILVTVRD